MFGFYLTRATKAGFVEMWPEEMGIRKYKGCVYYNSATEVEGSNDCCYFEDMDIPVSLCQEMFGFVPKCGEAWHIKPNGKGGIRKQRVELAFTKNSELDKWPWK